MNKNRTISSKLKKHLEAQQTEAKVLGLVKVASGISDQLSEQPVRNVNDEYTYTLAQLQEDVELLLNKAAVRIQDYYDTPIDQRKVCKAVESFANDFIDSLSPSQVVIGPYEPSVAGEKKEMTEIEVE